MPVEAAVDVEPGAVLPAVEDGPQSSHELDHPIHRVIELRAESFLDLRPDLGAEAEGEAAVRDQLQIVGLMSDVNRIARERDGDVGQQ